MAPIEIARAIVVWVVMVVVVALGSGSLVLESVAARPDVYSYYHQFDQWQCPTGFANFGDSLTDTGNSLTAFPFYSGVESSPYGETFFGAPAKRFSNGRLVPDFFSLAFGKPLLNGYFSATSFDYRYGVNFAEAGATAAPSSTEHSPFSVMPFQIGQFVRFKNSVFAAQRESDCGNFLSQLPSGNPFPGWLYTIEAGGNDILGALQSGVPLSTISSTIVPAVIGNITSAVTSLYGQSARRFLVFGIPAQGCATIVLTVMANSGFSTDSSGCYVQVNQLIQGFNAGLLQAIKGLRQNLAGATISFFDYYSANLEILDNPTTYGFAPSMILTACCGAPGRGWLNYNPDITCGQTSSGSNNCANVDQYVNWDGIHFTEAFYRVIANMALSGNFTDQGINYAAICSLDFSKFGPEVTYAQAYPGTCNNIFS